METFTLVLTMKVSSARPLERGEVHLEQTVVDMIAEFANRLGVVLMDCDFEVGPTDGDAD